MSSPDLSTPLPQAARADAPATSDPRVAEILASLRQAFLEKGFDGASMQDLARAAGMSVGNFYRYFRSKAGIVAAMIESDLHEIEADFAQLRSAACPFALMKKALRDRLPLHRQRQDGALWAEIGAAAQRNSDIGAAAMQMESRIQSALLDVIAKETDLPLEEAARRYGAEAQFILLLFKSANCATTADPDQDARLNDLIFDAIDRTLDTIAETARKR